MKVTVLVDDAEFVELRPKMGLSLHIEYNGRRFLLDTGSSSMFLEKARQSGIDIAAVDYVVISHAHYDHSCGLEAFFAANSKASVWLSPDAKENCYSGTGFSRHYIGLPKGVTASFRDRIVRPDGVCQIADGVFLVPHSTPGLERLGKRNKLYVRKGLLRFVPDDFSHEQTLVFKTPRGLVLMNSCSHSGPEVIVNEVLQAFPGEHIHAYLGGLHLFRLTDPEVDAVADRLEACGIDRIYTGHCTGQHAYDLLKARFGDRLGQFRCSLEIEI